MSTNLHIWSGSQLLDATARGWWNGTTEIPVQSVSLIPNGYPSVDEMLAQTTFYIAHRGGSIEWPEHSLQAYTMAVYYGYPALELALARTSDGVWFGLHDSDLDRTSAPADTPPASQMTWAEVEAFMINPPAEHPTRLSQPYMRLEEYLATYAQTHVTFLDPKDVALSATNPDWQEHLAELLDILDANGGPSRWVAKYYGKALGWRNAAKARGYKGWGYFFTGDGGTIDNWADSWDILGLSYDAPQSEWDAFLATGKPVVGHVCPTSTAADTALGKGAAGLMVSGTEAVTPVYDDATFTGFGDGGFGLGGFGG